MLPTKPMTKRELAECPDVSQACKETIEKAIADWSDGDTPGQIGKLK